MWRRDHNLGDGPVHDLHHHLLAAGIDISVRANSNNQPLHLHHQAGRPRAVLSDRLMPGGTRFWLAHALAHHVFDDPVPCHCPPPTLTPSEIRAMTFADCLLLPLRPARDLGDPSAASLLYGVTLPLARRQTRRAMTGSPPKNLRVSVLVDYREERSGVPDLLAGHADLDVHSVALPVGDYLLAGTLLVERKTSSDFVASVRDGRLIRQLAALSRTSNGSPPVLMLEGDGSGAIPSLGGPQRRGLLAWAVVSGGVSVVPSSGPADTAQLLTTMARRCAMLTKGSGSSRSRTTRNKHRAQSPRRGKNGPEAVLQAIDGIGPRRAQQLVAHFGSVAAVLRASKEELCAVTGIDGQLANLLRRGADRLDRR